MNQVSELITQLKTSKSDKDIEPLREEFRHLSFEEKQSIESDLVEILLDIEFDELIRSWIPAGFLGPIGTPTAREVLIQQLPDEKSELVRRWMAIALIQYFTGDDRITLVLEQLERERTVYNRRIFARILATSHSSIAIPKLLELLSSEDEHVRDRVSKELGHMQAQEAVYPLLEQLKVEEDPSVSQTIIKALVNIKDPQAIPVLLNVLTKENQPLELYISLLQGLGQLSSPNNDLVIQALVETACHTNRIVAITATDVLIKLISRPEAAQRLAEYGLQHSDPGTLRRVADALRIIGGTAIVDFLQGVQNDPVQKSRAHILLEQIGGQQAIDVIVQHRIDALQEAGSRVQEFDKQAQAIFQETISDAKQAFTISLWMSGTIFVVGTLLLVVSIYLMMQPNPTQQILGAGSGLAGLGSILAMFYKGPVERIEKSVANLVQTEIAFLGYIRQVTQITAMFEREYLKNEGFGLSELKKILGYTSQTVKETMPLINQYTAISISDDEASEPE